MEKFIAKVVVKLKPNIPDVKGRMIARAINSTIKVQNLVCNVGISYSLEFEAESQIEAFNVVEQIAKELLTNDFNEIYEIRSLDAVE